MSARLLYLKQIKFFRLIYFASKLNYFLCILYITTMPPLHLMVCSQPTKHETSNTIFVISTNLQYLLAESSGSKNFPLSLFPQHGKTLERSDFNLIEQPFTLHLKTISLSASRKDDLQIHPTLHACSLCSRLNVLYSSPTTYFGTRVSQVNLYVSLYCSLCLNASKPAKPAHFVRRNHNHKTSAIGMASDNHTGSLLSSQITCYRDGLR